MNKLKLVFQIIVVVGSMLTAGVFLYQENDARLEDVEFISATTIEETHRGSITTELEVTDDKEVSTGVPTEEASVRDTPSAVAFEGEAVAPEKKEGEAPTSEVNINAAATTPADEENSATVRIMGPNTSIVCAVPLSEPTTVHRLMQKASTQCDFVYSGKNYEGLGFFVNRLDSVSSNSKKGTFWIYSVNGVTATVGVSTQQVKSGDTITWSYQKSY